MDTDIKMEQADINDDKMIMVNSGVPGEVTKEKNNFNESIQNQANQDKDSRGNKPECFQCKVCPYNTFRKPFLYKHMLQKHGFLKVEAENKQLSEQVSGEMIKNNGDMTEKIQPNDGNGNDDAELKCNVCDFKTRHLNLLNIHQEIHEKKEEVFQCTQCHFKTQEIIALRDHEKTHKKITIFSCPKCDYATRQKCNLKAHMKVHEDPEKLERFNCATCKKFVSFHYSALLRHTRLKHGTDGKVFKCDQCPFTAKIQRHVINHQKIHAGHDEAPMFKCEKCDFVTYKEQTIQKHVQRHEEREKDGEEVIVKEKAEEKEITWFCCNKCDFKTKDHRYVILHKKVHTRIDEINKVGESLAQSAEENTESSQGHS